MEARLILGYVHQLKSWLHATSVGKVPWLENCLAGVIDMLSSPLTGIKTRYHWIQLTEALALAALVFYAGWHVRPDGGWRGFLRYAFPKALFKHPSSLVDYQLNVLNFFFAFNFNLTWRLSAALFTFYGVSLLSWAFGPVHDPWPITWPVMILFVALYYLAEDLGYYIFHYASHKIPFLWAIHKVHHSAEVLTIFTAGRVHPLEAAFSTPAKSLGVALVLAPAAYLFNYDPSAAQLFGVGAFVTISGALGEQLLHTHVWLSWGPVLERFVLSPAQHQVHHSSAPQHWDRNFAGRFTFWDWVFGTIYITHGPEQISYGIYGEPRQAHPNIAAAWLRPFWDMLPMREAIAAAGLRLFGARAASASASRGAPTPPAPPPATAASGTTRAD